jgi:hypothetical protein
VGHTDPELGVHTGAQRGDGRVAGLRIHDLVRKIDHRH